jgi:HD-GYP domain-containing protein (c-di-GMP phosphodiesterase class II)
MNKDDFEWVSTGDLRIGHYVELDLGWMAHPFPSGSFKISSEKQLQTLRGLGVERVRTIRSKSEPLAASHEVASITDAHLDHPSLAKAAVGSPDNSNADQKRKDRAASLLRQNSSLLACERRFGESVRQYRKTVELLPGNPLGAAELCKTTVQGFVSEMMQEGESAIRLLTETAGDRSSMHPVNVTVVSLLLGKAMGLEHHALVDLGLAAFLHDIGKIHIHERVRSLEDGFTTTQYKLYQEHVIQSIGVAKAMQLSELATLAIAQHHELADGSGFPAHMKSAAMSPASRIVSLVNRYDNLCNPVKPGSAMTPHESLALMFAQQKSRFDPLVLSAFIRMMGVYPPGSVVQLVDERYAMVVSVNSTRPLKPRVIVFDSGVSKHEALIVDLERNPNIGIRRSLKPSSLPSAAQEYLSPRQRICYFFEPAGDRVEEETTLA